eukprot:UN05098
MDEVSYEPLSDDGKGPMAHRTSRTRSSVGGWSGVGLLIPVSPASTLMSEDPLIRDKPTSTYGTNLSVTNFSGAEC